MLWKKGLNRIFIVLSIVAFFLGAIIGFNEWNVTVTPKTEDVFRAFDWNDSNINKYYEVAKNDFETYKTEKIKKNNDTDVTLDMFDFSPWKSGKYRPSDFRKNPPQFNNYFFSKAFPEAVQPQQPQKNILILYTLVTAIVFWSVCYGSLHLILFTILWIIKGFKRS